MTVRQACLLKDKEMIGHHQTQPLCHCRGHCHYHVACMPLHTGKDPGGAKPAGPAWLSEDPSGLGTIQSVAGPAPQKQQAERETQ